MVLATFLQEVFQYDTRLNSFVGGIAMGIAAIPIIFTITEDALTAVPKTFNEASLALGASKWQTAFFVILPAATPGIFAAILLGIGRVFGETMIALMATGNAAQMGLNPFESVVPWLPPLEPKWRRWFLAIPITMYFFSSARCCSSSPS
jgi:phosphate transport system permease protein